MRLVLDTSVIVAAFRSQIGASSRLLQLLQDGRFTAIATPTLLFEYESVLKRPGHRLVHCLSDELLESAIENLAALIEPVRIDFQWKPQLPDPDDELVLEAATNGLAFAIVTHNVRDFEPARSRFGIHVFTPGVIIQAEVLIMAASTSPVMLPESIVRAAEVQARIRGVSLEDWVSRAVTERLDTPEGAREYFRNRAAGSTGDGLSRALAAAPNRPPDPGDELES